MRKILVMSGKGGVGKTTISVNLAVKLSKKYKTGLLDVDIHGPNVPKLLGIENKKIEIKKGKIVPINYSSNLKVMSIAFLLENKDDPIIWRGPLKHKIIDQFINDVEWGKIDYLIIDLPPGTGDEIISISQIIPKPAEVLIVSMPQEVSIIDAKKAIGFSRNMGLKIIGIIENMSGNIFGSGNVEKLAKEKNIIFLGKIKLDERIIRLSDKGIPFVNSLDSREFDKIVNEIESFK